MFKQEKMFALVNYDRVMLLQHRRKDCVQAGIELVVGGEEKYRRMIRDGSFKIVPVLVTPLKQRRRK